MAGLIVRIFETVTWDLSDDFVSVTSIREFIFPPLKFPRKAKHFGVEKLMPKHENNEKWMRPGG
jgi:hypothetical protein